MDANDFWSQVQRTGTCWLWRGERIGYHHISWAEFYNVPVHRIAYTLTYGPIPPGLVVRHRCDNPPCVRPDHLELGTHSDNIRDQTLRDRRRHKYRIRTVTPGATISKARLDRMLRYFDIPLESLVDNAPY